MHWEGKPNLFGPLRLALAGGLVLLAAALGACGGPAGVDSPIQAPDDPGYALPPGIHAQALPAFPPELEPSPFRRVSDTTIDIDGANHSDQAGENNYVDPVEPSKYVLIPGGDDDLAWAQYSWSNPVEHPVDLTINVSSAPLLPGGDDDLPLSYWIGLSNYSQGYWEWHGPYSETQSLTLNSDEILDTYSSADGDFSYVVLVYGGMSAASHAVSSKSSSATPDVAVSVDVCQFNTRTVGGAGWFNTRPPLTPIDAVSVDKVNGAITINWMHQTAPGGPSGNDATSYRISRIEVGQPGITLLGQLPAPGGTFTDPLDNQGGVAGPEPGKRYRYVLRALNDSGACAPAFSPRVGIDGAPVALIRLLPGAGGAPVNCLLDASSSFDPDDGVIMKYEWDVDGDGTYDFDDGSMDTRTQLYTLPGTYAIGLRVTDDLGNTDTDTRNLIVTGWTRGFGGALADNLSCVAFDQPGNIYLGGSIAESSHTDALLLSYTADGLLRFAKRLGGPVSDEYITDIRSGPSGDLYLAGSSQSVLGTNLRAARVSVLGEVLWSLDIGESDGDTYASALRLDAAEQFLYIAGITTVYGTGGRDFYLLKVDCSDGSVVWNRTWGTTGDEFAYGLAVFGQDEIYIGGSLVRPGNTDAALLKYNSQGQRLWARQWGGGGYDEFTVLDCDSTGMVFAAGYSDSFDPNGDLLLLSYDPAGLRGLERGYGGSEHESVFDMQIDAQNRILICAGASGYSAFSDSLFAAVNIWGNPIVQRRLSLQDGNALLTGLGCQDGQLVMAGSSRGRSGNWLAFNGASYPLTGTEGIPAGAEQSPAASITQPAVSFVDVGLYVEDAPPGIANDALIVSVPLKP